MTITSSELRRRRLQSDATRYNDEDGHERRWVTGPTLRRMLDISPPTLWRWRRKPDFPRAKVIHGRTFYNLAEVDAWMAAQPDVAA